MPREYVFLKKAPAPFKSCSKCGAKPFRPFLRGQVARSRLNPLTRIRWWWRHGRKPFPSFAVICWDCKEIVGYEGVREVGVIE